MQLSTTLEQMQAILKYIFMTVIHHQEGYFFHKRPFSRLSPSAGHLPLSFSLDTIGLTGNHNFYISVDPNNRIDETNETNNIAWNSLTIGSSGLNLSISTDKTSYTANEDILITVNIQDILGSDRSGTLTVKVVDLNNNVVSTVTTNQSVTLSPNENKALNLHMEHRPDPCR